MMDEQRFLIKKEARSQHKPRLNEMVVEIPSLCEIVHGIIAIGRTFLAFS